MHDDTGKLSSSTRSDHAVYPKLAVLIAPSVRLLLAILLPAMIVLTAGCPVAAPVSDTECMAILENCISSFGETDESIGAVCDCAEELARGLNGGCCPHPWQDEPGTEELPSCEVVQEYVNTLLVVCREF